MEFWIIFLAVLLHVYVLGILSAGFYYRPKIKASKPPALRDGQISPSDAARSWRELNCPYKVQCDHVANL